MSRRLLATKPGRGLYEYDDEFGRYQVWEPLSPPAPVDRMPLVQPPRLMPGLSLYGPPRPRAPRSRWIDRLLQSLGIR